MANTQGREVRIYEDVGRVFEQSRDLTVGIEEEFQILAADSLELTSRYDDLKVEADTAFGRELAFRAQRTAQPFGAKAHEILASNLAPTPGTDRRGPTAVIKSHCSVDFSRLPCGTALDLKVLPATVQGEAGLGSLIGLMRAFVDLGGIFMQIDVVDSALLRDAQAHPEKYPNLSVRVSGWSARFATLSKEWQDMIIARTDQALG